MRDHLRRATRVLLICSLHKLERETGDSKRQVDPNRPFHWKGLQCDRPGFWVLWYGCVSATERREIVQTTGFYEAFSNFTG